MADEQDWTAYADQATLADTDTILARTAAGAGVEVPGSALVKKNGSGNVGVGTSSPAARLEVKDTALSVAITIDNANIGSSSSNFASLELGDNGSMRAYFRSYRDGTGRVAIGYNDHLALYSDAGGTPTERLRVLGNGTLRPAVTNASDLGTSSLAFKSGYIQNAWTVTSDATLKNQLGGLDAAQIRAGKRIVNELCWWQWLESIKAKGDNARWHFGPMAQDIGRILIEEGVESDYGEGSPSFRSDFLGWDRWDAVTQPVMKETKGTRIEQREVRVQTGEEEVEQKFTLFIDGKSVDATQRITVPVFGTVTQDVEVETIEMVDTGKVQIISPAGSGWRIEPTQLCFFLLACLNADFEQRLTALEGSA